MLKRLSNYSEQRVHEEIVGTAEQYLAHIYRKIRVADVVDIGGLSSSTLRTYALQAHFDFCIADDDNQPQLAIEYDGGGHDRSHDHKKDEIARQANLALFRIDERLLNRTRGGITFLQYLVHTYFLGQMFANAQRNGSIDPSEPFIMSGFIKDDAKHIFDSEFDFLNSPFSRINKLFSRHGLTSHLGYHTKISHVLLGKADSSFVGFASIPINGAFIFGRAVLDIGTPCLGQLGEVPYGWSALSDYCEGMVLEDLCDAAEAYFANGAHTLRSRRDVESEAAELGRRGYRALRAGGGDDRQLMRYGFPKRGGE